MLVLQSRGQVEVAIYDKVSNKLVRYGWVDVPKDWTITKYDWEGYIVRQK